MTTRYTKKELEKELVRVRHKRKYISVLRNTLAVLVTVSAIAVLVATLWMPVLQIYGDSMSPTLTEGNLVVCVKEKQYKTGDIVAFYYNNKILVKRVICSAGDYVDIDLDGRVYVNGALLDEPYIEEFSYGDTNIRLPYQVPEGKTFVMGDHRATSLDSRNTAIGSVSDEQIVGKLIFRIWPFGSISQIR